MQKKTKKGEVNSVAGNKGEQTAETEVINIAELSEGPAEAFQVAAEADGRKESAIFDAVAQLSEIVVENDLPKATTREVAKQAIATGYGLTLKQVDNPAKVKNASATAYSTLSVVMRLLFPKDDKAAAALEKALNSDKKPNLQAALVIARGKPAKARNGGDESTTVDLNTKAGLRAYIQKGLDKTELSVEDQTEVLQLLAEDCEKGEEASETANSKAGK